MNRKQEKLFAVKPSPETLIKLIAMHGTDLLAWPRTYRLWLLMSEDAGDFVMEHAPGMFDGIEAGLEEWTQKSLFDFAKSKEDEEDIPF